MADVESLDILVVEDDPDARANLRDILELDGHRITTTGTAAEALGRTDLAHFSVVILDRKLPDATADEILPVIRRAAPMAAVVIVTGFSDLQGAIAALRQGASDYILKPLNPDALRASLERIADRRRLALAKERSDAAFRQLVEAAECLIVIIRPDRSILYFNPFAERATGYSIQEVTGQGDRIPLIPTDLHKTIDVFVDRVLGVVPIDETDEPIVCRDGSRRWIVWHTRKLDDYEGGPATLGVGQDITDLKKAQERALQAERLAAIGQMVTGLAHESRNALQRSQACLEMLAMAEQGHPRSIDLIGRIQRAQDDLHRLFEDVRGYASPIRLERRLVDLAEVWRNAWADLESARSHRRARLRELDTTTHRTCLVDPFRLGQVFRNLFDNSLAATSDPVEILIRVEPEEIEGRPGLRISVTDNGPGLTTEQASQLFEPFYTTKTKGTGLGLAIARRFVEAHGGRIHVGDPKGPGTEIVLTIPRGDS